jgi:multidrug efflux pump subunit AcrA (membrane-fusion protein)
MIDISLREPGPSTLKAGEWLVGPKHTAWKLAGLALLTGAGAGHLREDGVSRRGADRAQPRSKFVVSVPFDGVIAKLPDGVEAGKAVKQGDVLVEMDETDAKLRQLDARSQITQAEREADAYLKAGKLAEAGQAQARADQARAKAALADRDIERSRIVSPIDGVIIAGDLSDKVGSTVKIGDVLFQIAKVEDMVVVARVSDRDIGLLRTKGADPTKGEIATKSDPAAAYPFEVERIVPLAQAAEGKNSFEVRGKLMIADAAARKALRAGRPTRHGRAGQT